MTTALTAINITFRHDTLNAVRYQGEIYVPMRRIVENLGMAWGTQQQKLMRNTDKFGCIHMNMVAADGKIRHTLCIPLQKLNGWLFSINASRVRPDLRQKVTTYQEECFQVLYEHFTTKIQAQNAAAQCDEENAYYVNVASEHFSEILHAWHHHIEPVLFQLKSPLATHLHDRFNETSAMLAKVSRRLRRNLPENTGKYWP
ncbi:phage antirepressor N-terminal domain-containing protein [Enterobacteriaceae bacterium LUAb1]